MKLHRSLLLALLGLTPIAQAINTAEASAPGNATAGLTQTLANNSVQQHRLTFFGEPLTLLTQGNTDTAAAISKQLLTLEQQLNAAQAPASLLQSCETWRSTLAPYFTCHPQTAQHIWQTAASSGELPNRTALRKQVRSQRQQAVQFNQLEQAWLNAWALAQLHSFLQQQGLSAQLQLGNLILQQGDFPLPSQALEHLAAAQALPQFNQGVLAFSAHEPSNYWRIGQRRFSKILNPSDGWPNNQAKPFMLVAPDALSAQALASALPHMSINAGLAAARAAHADALLLTAGGKGFASSGWYARIPALNTGLAWGESMEFSIEYTIPNHNIASYRRPYTAMWISSKAQPNLRQLQLQGDSERWLQTLSQWWRRHGSRDASLIDGLSGASATPGNYRLVWDGRDDAGNPVAPGDYQLHFEIAREHGEREHLSLAFTLDGQAFSISKKGKQEVGQITLGLHSTVD